LSTLPGDIDALDLVVLNAGVLGSIRDRQEGNKREWSHIEHFVRPHWIAVSRLGLANIHRCAL